MPGAAACSHAIMPARVHARDAPSANQEHMMSKLTRRNALAGGVLAVLLTAAAQPALSEEKGATKLFKIVSVKDEIIIGVNDSDMSQAGGANAGAIARVLAAEGHLTAWEYSVKRGTNGEMQQVPTHQVGVLANGSLRVEPYTSPYAVVSHQ